MVIIMENRKRNTYVIIGILAAILIAALLFLYLSARDTCGVHSVDTKNKYVEILRFKLFHDYFVFEEDGQGFKKKVLKKHFKVSVVVDLVSGDTRK